MECPKSYSNKKSEYFESLRHDIIKLVPQSSRVILDIGCGKGTTLLKLKEIGKAMEIVGVDVNKFEGNNLLDGFIQGDIEEVELPYENYFDVIICADVLEHLEDPWNALTKIKKYLRDGGVLIASIPNIRELSNLYNIYIKGTFKYADSGILDKTHLRFFCKKDIIKLFGDAGFKIKKITFDIPFFSIASLCNRLTFGIFNCFFVVQYLIVSEKNKI